MSTWGLRLPLRLTSSSLPSAYPLNTVSRPPNPSQMIKAISAGHTCNERPLRCSEGALGVGSNTKRPLRATEGALIACVTCRNGLDHLGGIRGAGHGIEGVGGG